MRIDRVETLRADAAWRSFSFLKIVTACGITGWSEYNEDFGSRGLSPVIDRVLPLAEVSEAHRLLQERGVFGKVVVDPGGGAEGAGPGGAREAQR